jgi:hypothetical protein
VPLDEPSGRVVGEAVPLAAGRERLDERAVGVEAELPAPAGVVGARHRATAAVVLEHRAAARRLHQPMDPAAARVVQAARAAGGVGDRGPPAHPVVLGVRGGAVGALVGEAAAEGVVAEGG